VRPSCHENRQAALVPRRLGASVRFSCRVHRVGQRVAMARRHRCGRRWRRWDVTQSAPRTLGPGLETLGRGSTVPRAGRVGVARTRAGRRHPDVFRSRNEIADHSAGARAIRQVWQVSGVLPCRVLAEGQCRYRLPTLRNRAGRQPVRAGRPLAPEDRSDVRYLTRSAGLSPAAACGRSCRRSRRANSRAARWAARRRCRRARP
jgi:hypothetical protein